MGKQRGNTNSSCERSFLSVLTWLVHILLVNVEHFKQVLLIRVQYFHQKRVHSPHCVQTVRVKKICQNYSRPELIILLVIIKISANGYFLCRRKLSWSIVGTRCSVYVRFYKGRRPSRLRFQLFPDYRPENQGKGSPY